MSTTMQRIRATGLLAAVGLAFVCPGALAQGDGQPSTLVLKGTIRDFKSRGETGGHTDFEWQPKNALNKGSYGQYLQIVNDELDADGKPSFRSKGYRLTAQWTDSQGNNIISPKGYITAKDGDHAGSMEGQGYAVENADKFAQWYRDVPGVNVSKTCSITLKRDPNSGKYVFDDKDDELFKSRGGFFPINDELYGNYSTTGKNFHFTYELSTEFTYKANSGQIFRFIGDDDVWVYVDGKLVIDLGGVHGATAQTINMDRLSWLQDNKAYSLKFFFAERHTTESNFRIETTLQLRDVNVPTVSALYD
ncbi:MAG: fibro-slime domain-containing protein [Phycisphaerales bacterium]|nr:fibro-slime domain-containing protein [Phycisphaerales bacterium]